MAALATTGCGGCQRRGPEASAPEPQGKERVVTLIATTELRGTPEPCGCQSDPLGDLARVAALYTEAGAKARELNAGGALLLDAGGLRYQAEPIPKEQRAQAELKAEFLEQAFARMGAVIGLGDEDLVMGPGRVPPGARVCSNVSGLPVAPPVVRDVGGVKVGVFGVVDPTKEAWQAAGLSASDPTEAARRAAAQLSSQGAQVIVALTHLGRPAARKLAREVPGLSVVVAGDEAGDSGGEPEQVGETIVVQPANQGQKVVRVELHVVDAAVSTSLFAGAEERSKALTRIEKRLDQVGRDLLRLKADPSADPSYVHTKEVEQARLQGERAELHSASPTPPPGSYALAQLVDVRRKIPRDEAVVAGMKRLDARIGEANRAAAEKILPPPVPAGEASYAGMDECEDCHEKAVKFWKTTVHAKAWKELVAVNKQWSYDCIGCHVTGYGRAGGSSMAHVDKLEAVQCELCHGPGSQHNLEPKKYKLKNPAEADCKDCHTKEHSDTFQYEPYLRDILGPGHGQKRRTALGPGLTGYDLRHGAKERAEGKP